VGADEAANLRVNVARARELGAQVELLSPAEVRALVPQIAADDIALASYERESGFADPHSTTTALAARARELGAAIIQNETVEEILTTGDRVAGVRTTHGRISAPLVVNCAGPWAARLLAPLGIDLEIQAVRHQMCVFGRPSEWNLRPAVVDRPNGTYMRPEHGDLILHGVGSYGEVVDPDEHNARADPDQIVRNAELLAKRFPVMEHGVAEGGYAAVYDVTPDRQPVLGAIPEYVGLHADFGWSGHGFKHAPVIGDILSDVALYGASNEYDITPFRWSRFREGDLLPVASWTAPPHEKLRERTRR
jgi:glycine/D-amino acid oxidase-like deaminating enzyme